MKKTIAILLILCFCLSAAACASKPVQNGDEISGTDGQSAEEIIRAAFEANRLDTVLSRHDSVTYTTVRDPGLGMGIYTWETADEVYCEWGSAGSQYNDRRGIFYRTDRNEETGDVSVYCGAEIDPDRDAWYSFSPENEADFFDPEHDRITELYEKDGLLYIFCEKDELWSRAEIESSGAEYAGQTVVSETVVDADTKEIVSHEEKMISDGEETLLESMTAEYDTPKPDGCRELTELFDPGDGPAMTLTFILDRGSDHESERSVTVKQGVDCGFIGGEKSYVQFGDPDCETSAAAAWDRMSDNTWYIFTDPDEELVNKYNEAEERAAAAKYSRAVMDTIFEENGTKAVLKRHDSVYCAVDMQYCEGYYIYYDADGIFYMSDPEWLYTDGEIWFTMTDDSGETGLGLYFLAMSSDEADMMAEMDSAGIISEFTGKEILTDASDNGDGTITVTLVLSEEDGREWFEQNEDYLPPCDKTGTQFLSEFTLDAETAEIIREEDYLIKDDEKILCVILNPVYDAPRPEGVDKMLALREQYGAAGPDRAKTLTVIYDAGTDAEQRFSRQTDRGVNVEYILREGYTELSKETVESPDGTGICEITVYAAAEETPEK